MKQPLPSHQKNPQKGFTLLEMLIYIALLSVILLSTSSFIFYFIQADKQTQGDREVTENARRALEEMAYEINGAKTIYTPTTGANQLSLETSRYLPAGEDTSYLDFYLCGQRLCLKKDSQNPIFLTSDTVQVTGLTFTQVSINGAYSVRMNITIYYPSQVNGANPQVSLTSTASLRN